MIKIDLDACIEELKQVSIPAQETFFGGASLPTVTCTASYPNDWGMDDNWDTEWSNNSDQTMSPSENGSAIINENFGGNAETSVSCSYQDDPKTNVNNGDCVRGAIEEAIRNNGGEPNSKDIDQTLQDIAGPKESEGYNLNSETFREAVDEYLETHMPEGQSDLKEQIENGKEAIARIDGDGDGDREHAILITGSDDDGFFYYDPVLGTDNNYINNSQVYDPLIIDGLKK